MLIRFFTYALFASLGPKQRVFFGRRPALETRTQTKKAYFSFHVSKPKKSTSFFSDLSERSERRAFFVHFFAYAQLIDSRKSEFLAKNLSFRPKNRGGFLEILSFLKVY